MATQALNVAGFAGQVFIDLLYDDVSLAVSAVQARNQSDSPVFVTVQNSTKPSQQVSGTLAAGGTRTIAIPAGVFTLKRVTGLSGNSELSYVPWTVQTRWPA